MFGCEAVIWNESAGIGADGNMTDEVPVCLCRAPVKPTSIVSGDLISV
jgi:hypothetical protein